MKKSLFQRESIKAKMFHELGERADYYRGYWRGLRRRYHGEIFGEPGEHEKWLSLVHDKYTAEMGQGYRDGYFGPVDWDDPATAVRTIRQWREWNAPDLAEKLDVSPRTVEGWEQGRPVTGPALQVLKILHTDDS